MTRRLASLDRNWLVVAALSPFVWAPLLYPGFLQTQSGLAALYRLAQPAAGAFFPTVPGDGAPLAWALASLAHAAGLDPAASVRLTFASALLLSGLTMYLAARRLLGRAGGLVAALVYACLPYLLAVVYARGALPEAMAMALLPLAVWAVDLVARPVAAPPAGRGGHLTPPALALAAGLVLSLAHPGLTLAAVPLLLAFAASASGRRALGLTALCLAPGALVALAQLWPLASSAAPVEAADFYRLFSPAWQAGPGGTPQQLGVVAVVLALLTISERFLGRPEDEPATEGAPDEGPAALPGLSVPTAGSGSPCGPAWPGAAGFFAAATIALLVLMLPPAATVLWPALHLQAVLPQPWQLLGLAGVTLALAAGAALAGRRWGPMLSQPPILAALVVAILLASYPYLSPRYLRDADLPDVSQPPLARFEDNVLLAGYRIEQPAGARAIRLTLIWQALAPVQGDYTVFTHLLDAQGTLQGQKDNKPLAGARPTVTWARGEVLVDVYDIPLAPAAGSGSHILEIGLYQPEKDRRVPQIAPQAGATEVRLPMAIR